MKPDNKFLSNLQDHLRRSPRAVLLFSGGLDSSLLLAAAAPVLGSGLTVLTFTGPHIPPGELAAACALARRRQVRHLLRSVNPLAVPEFRENTPRRCYACKKAIILQARQLAAACGTDTLWDGTNLDDLADYRPGLEAARELGVSSPLLEAGLGKAAIRRLSRELGLDAIKPPQSCLATRFPYHTILTPEALARVGRAEAWLRHRGFTRVRLRVQGTKTRLELPPEEWAVFLRPQIHRPFRALVQRLGWEELSLG